MRRPRRWRWRGSCGSKGVVAIPKAAHLEHVRENRGALDIELSSEDIDELDDAFPPPTRKTPLEMILRRRSAVSKVGGRGRGSPSGQHCTVE